VLKGAFRDTTAPVNGQVSAQPHPITGLPMRVRIALALLILAVLVPLPTTGGRVVALLPSLKQIDWITAQDRRLAPARDALIARGLARVGYLPRPSLRTTSDILADRHYLATRYALAPIMVLPSSRPVLVFADLVDEPRAIPDEFELAEQLGDRLMLLRRKAP